MAKSLVLGETKDGKLKKASLFPEIFDLKVSESKRLYDLKLGFLSMKYRENQGSISLCQ